MISLHSRQDNNLVWHEMRQTEDFLASEFSKLSVEERSEALNDIHCVGEELKETPEMLEMLLKQFDQTARQVRNHIYTVAVNQRRAFFEDSSFQLRFLRCNMYDVHQSVRQMVKFLENKAAYFGKDKISREITIQDLKDEAKELLLSGLYHIQEGRDQSGRVVLYLLNDKFGSSDIVTMVVGIYYDMTKPGETFVSPGITFLLALMDAVASFPMRYSALHICLKPKNGSLALSNTLLHYTLNLTSVHTRTRTRIHYGTDMELQYTLRRHGVPTESCPVDIDGNVRGNILNDWFQKHEAEIRRLNQRMANQMQPIRPQDVRPQDVLLGRGYRVQNHPGNFWFRNFLLAHRGEYDITPRSRRQEISIRLTRTLIDNGTRFLKQDEGGEWIEADVEEAEKKVAQLFRTFRKIL
ncbi:unnamed protein product [Cylindrotheca closterium]|uniref:DUF6824 domain-containing protein n=1 Tax=Cylindrotheca closterium TaxID=2856 RepID=A0AAD2FFY4_9STRA|nr:unnamed protein product [Cylindrotheca closterium]